MNRNYPELIRSKRREQEVAERSDKLACDVVLGLSRLKNPTAELVHDFVMDAAAGHFRAIERIA